MHIAVQTPTAAKKLTVPPDVQVYARELGVEHFLPAVLGLVESVFADAKCMSVEVHDDPEAAGLRWILFEVDVPWSREQWRDAMKTWHRELPLVCPSPQRCLISLIAYRRP